MDYDYIVESYEDILFLQQKYSLQHTCRNIFYRGQVNSAWKLEPSILRDNSTSEYEIIQNAMQHHNIEMPISFPFEYIAKMQHYGFPTRFLDLSTDINIALFFACFDPENQDVDGRLFIFAYGPRKPSNIQALILSELCLLDKEITIEDFSQKLIGKYPVLHNSYGDIQKLNMDIASFFDHGFAVLPTQKDYAKMSLYNPRIQRQFGAFFICGNRPSKPLITEDRFLTHSGNNIILPEVNSIPATLWHHDYACWIIIPSWLKPFILAKLNEKGITKSYLFAEGTED